MVAGKLLLARTSNGPQVLRHLPLKSSKTWHHPAWGTTDPESVRLACLPTFLLVSALFHVAEDRGFEPLRAFTQHAFPVWEEGFRGVRQPSLSVKSPSASGFGRARTRTTETRSETRADQGPRHFCCAAAFANRGTPQRAGVVRGRQRRSPGVACSGLTVENADDYVRIQVELVKQEVVRALRFESKRGQRARRKVAEVGGHDEVGLSRTAAATTCRSSLSGSTMPSTNDSHPSTQARHLSYSGERGI
jgi:hypothetical protein